MWFSDFKAVEERCHGWRGLLVRARRRHAFDAIKGEDMGSHCTPYYPCIMWYFWLISMSTGRGPEPDQITSTLPKGLFA